MRLPFADLYHTAVISCLYREENEPVSGALTVLGHGMCTSTSSQDTRKRDPVCQESEGHYAPPYFVEGCRGLEQEAIEHQE